jgi:hypothetical protein
VAHNYHKMILNCIGAVYEPYMSWSKAHPLASLTRYIATYEYFKANSTSRPFYLARRPASHPGRAQVLYPKCCCSPELRANTPVPGRCSPAHRTSKLVQAESPGLPSAGIIYLPQGRQGSDGIAAACMPRLSMPCPSSFAAATAAAAGPPAPAGAPAPPGACRCCRPVVVRRRSAAAAEAGGALALALAWPTS